MLSIWHVYVKNVLTSSQQEQHAVSFGKTYHLSNSGCIRQASFKAKSPSNMLGVTRGRTEHKMQSVTLLLTKIFKDPRLVWLSQKGLSIKMYRKEMLKWSGDEAAALCANNKARTAFQLTPEKLQEEYDMVSTNRTFGLRRTILV